MGWDQVGSRILLSLSFIGCVVAIWMMLHGYGISGTPTGGSDGAGLCMLCGLENVCVGFVWMSCGFILVLLAGQGFITGVIVAFLPREQWVEHDLDAVSVSPQEEDLDD